MIKRLKPVLILAGVALVLGILLWVLIAFVLPKDEAGDEKGNSVTLMEVDLTEADRIEIRNTIDEYTLVKQAIGTYYMEGKKGYSVNSESVVSLLEKLGSLTATKKLIDNPSEEQLKSYALTNPRGTVTVTDDEKSYTFYFGTKTSSGSYYIRLEGDKAVYLISTAIPDIVLLSRYQFYSNHLIQYSEESADLETFKEFTISGHGRPQEIYVEMNDLGENEVGTSYVMRKPFFQSFSDAMQDELSDLLTNLATCPIVGDDTGAEALKQYGLDDPVYTLSFKMMNITQTVHFGDVNDSGYQYCYLEGGKFVHYVEETYSDMLGAPIKDFCEDMIYTNAADTLAQIKITGSGKTYTITVGEQDEEGNFNVHINNKNVDSELFSDFYSHILTIGITDLGQKEGSAEAYLTVRFTLKDGTVDTMKFYPVSELKCFCELNGSGQFWVSTQSVDKILENAQKLYDGDVIQTEW